MAKVQKIKRQPLEFVHLHSHDEYSMRDGTGKVEQYINVASERNSEGFTMTNHGGNGQWVRQYFHMKEVNEKRIEDGLKPIKNIFGEESYFMYNREEKLGKINEINSTLQKKKGKKNSDVNTAELQQLRKDLQKSYHIILLAKNQTGFDNLLYLHNDAMVNGYYYHANVSWQKLKENSEGLIVLSACVGGAIAQPILQGDIKEAESRAKEFKEIWGDDFYIELQLHDYTEQFRANKELIRIAKKFNIKMVITNDSHYLNEEDWEAQGTLTLSQSGMTWKDWENGNEKAWVFESRQLWYKTEPEIYREYLRNHADYLDYKDYKEAILETVRITEKVDENINFREKENHIPQYCNPPEKAEEILKSKINKGFKERHKLGDKKYIDRIKYEMDIIKYKGAEHYFLIVEDYINYAKKKYGEEAVAPGRGSGASSLVNYMLKITDIDPLFWELPFERFLSKGRKDMPDIDSDFFPEIRDDVKAHLIEKYGQDYTASIGTYGTYQTKGCIDDVLKAFGFEASYISELKKSLVEDIDDLEDWDEILKLNEKLREFAEENPNVFRVIKVLRGQIRHMSKHAGGVLITKNPIMYDVSLSKVGDTICTSWVEGQTRSELGRIGRVKFDILGLETLSELKYANDLVEERTGHRIDWKKVNLYDDKESVKMANKGDTKWIFQFQQQGMITLLKNAKIKSVRDWSAISALGRPGPKRSGMADAFCRRSKGKEDYELHPLIEKVIGETYGVITYQEHVMFLGVVLADFTMDEADELRKVLTKIKKETEHIYGARRDELKKKFISRASKKLGSKKEAEKIWDLMAQFAAYGFNKAHATCYGIISARCLYMMAHHPVEWLTSVLNSQSTKFKEGEESKMVHYVKEAKQTGFSVLFPQINKSTWRMTVSDDEEIVYGLSFIKGVGEAAAQEITKKKYSKIEDFFNTKFSGKLVNARVYEALIKIGYFDSLFENRKAVHSAWMDWKEKKTGNFRTYLEKYEDEPDFTQEELSNFEKEFLGMYIGNHPLQKYDDVKEEYELCSIEESKDYKKCNIMGMLTSIRPYKCKNGAMMAFTEIEDSEQKLSVSVFPKEFARYKEILKPGTCIAMKVASNSKGTSVDGYADGAKIMLLDELLPNKHKTKKVAKKKKAS